MEYIEYHEIQYVEQALLFYPGILAATEFNVFIGTILLYNAVPVLVFGPVIVYRKIIVVGQDYLKVIIFQVLCKSHAR